MQNIEREWSQSATTIVKPIRLDDDLVGEILIELSVSCVGAPPQARSGSQGGARPSPGAGGESKKVAELPVAGAGRVGSNYHPLVFKRMVIVLEIMAQTLEEWEEEDRNLTEVSRARISWFKDFFLPVGRVMAERHRKIPTAEAIAAVSMLFADSNTRTLGANLNSLLLELETVG